MTILEKLEAISAHVQTLDLFTSWGGICTHYADKQVPYGVGTTRECAGNIYGYNEKERSGYIMLQNIAPAPITGVQNRFEVTARIYSFIPYKLIGNTSAGFDVPLKLVQALYTRFRPKYTFAFDMQRVERFPDFEVGFVSITFYQYGECGDLTIGAQIC